jgi:hypothetical protein
MVFLCPVNRHHIGSTLVLLPSLVLRMRNVQSAIIESSTIASPYLSDTPKVFKLLELTPGCCIIDIKDGLMILLLSNEDQIFSLHTCLRKFAHGWPHLSTLHLWNVRLISLRYSEKTSAFLCVKSPGGFLLRLRVRGIFPLFGVLLFTVCLVMLYTTVSLALMIFWLNAEDLSDCLKANFFEELSREPGGAFLSPKRSALPNRVSLSSG